MTTKKAWEMTIREFMASIPMSEYVKDMEPAMKLGELNDPSRGRVLPRIHKMEVKEALANGNIVPLKVSKDYPELNN